MTGCIITIIFNKSLRSVHISPLPLQIPALNLQLPEGFPNLTPPALMTITWVFPEWYADFRG